MSLISVINKKFKNNSKFYWTAREYYVIINILFSRLLDSPSKNSKKRILIYHFSSISYGGTEKYLQIVARKLNKEKYSVFFMYPTKMLEDGIMSRSRLNKLTEAGVSVIPFDYSSRSTNPPYIVSGLNPDITNLVDTLNIDLFLTADSGGPNFPFSIMRSVPIILINIFGQPNTQKNILTHLCISKEVSEKLSPVVSEQKRVVLPIPQELPNKQLLLGGIKIREKFNIGTSDFLFGRIGRPDDGIFDPIAIRAFQRIVKLNPNAHYLIMAPMPLLQKLVRDEKIVNVHFLPPSADDADIWAFHGAIDALAHFRNDGESFGLNITESMFAGNPIITHRSHLWNAHLEYLDPIFSFVAEKDDVSQYSDYMKKVMDLKAQGKIDSLCLAAKQEAQKLFLSENIIPKIENLIDSAFTRRNFRL